MMAVFSGIAGLAPAGCILKPWLHKYVLADSALFIFVAVPAVIQRVREYRRKKRAGEMPAAAGTAARLRRRLPAQDSVYLSEGVLSFLLFSYLAP